MIYDRTIEDVTQALEIRKNYVQKGLPLEQSQIDILERGTLTINTINRIENKIQELQNKFNEIYYFCGDVSIKNWQRSQIFYYETEFTRILHNIELLMQAFYVKNDTPQIPEIDVYFQNINDMEKILYDLETVYNDMQSLFRECGTFECGEM